MRAKLETADVLRAYAEDHLRRPELIISPEQRRVINALVACRTKQLGGHLERCGECGHERPVYNSCRNRHCPKCQASARAAWMEARAGELLNVPYFHLVFTLPESLGDLALQNKRTVYDILFRAAAQTVLQIAADERHLGAEAGMLMVLHTWGQNLLHHPHVHCVVPSGGISKDGQRWIAGGSKFFLPVRVLSRVFRGKFLALLRQAFRQRRLVLRGQLAHLAGARQFERLLSISARRDWVVYAKRPFGGPRQVLAYLARYTHRVAISNQRLVAMKDGKVSFHWKDYADGNRVKVMTLALPEFVRRFLLHVLPSGFVHIRHVGFLANRHRTEKLALCRKLLGQEERKLHAPVSNIDDEPPPAVVDDDSERVSCPLCNSGEMRIVQQIDPEPRRPAPIRRPFMLVLAPAAFMDSS